MLIKVNACGVCRTDLHVVEGELGNVNNIVPGHEVVGTIEKVGSEVNTQKIGNKWGLPGCTALAEAVNTVLAAGRTYVKTRDLLAFLKMAVILNTS